MPHWLLQRSSHALGVQDQAVSLHSQGQYELLYKVELSKFAKVLAKLVCSRAIFSMSYAC